MENVQPVHGKRTISDDDDDDNFKWTFVFQKWFSARMGLGCVPDNPIVLLYCVWFSCFWPISSVIWRVNKSGLLLLQLL